MMSRAVRKDDSCCTGVLVPATAALMKKANIIPSVDVMARQGPTRVVLMSRRRIRKLGLLGRKDKRGPEPVHKRRHQDNRGKATDHHGHRHEEPKPRMKPKTAQHQDRVACS